jgi:hypothetical protein
LAKLEKPAEEEDEGGGETSDDGRETNNGKIGEEES